MTAIEYIIRKRKFIKFNIVLQEENGMRTEHQTKDHGNEFVDTNKELHRRTAKASVEILFWNRTYDTLKSKGTGKRQKMYSKIIIICLFQCGQYVVTNLL